MANSDHTMKNSKKRSYRVVDNMVEGTKLRIRKYVWRAKWSS
jgi:hypothetical protein